MVRSIEITCGGSEIIKSTLIIKSNYNNKNDLHGKLHLYLININNITISMELVGDDTCKCYTPDSIYASEIVFTHFQKTMKQYYLTHKKSAPKKHIPFNSQEDLMSNKKELLNSLNNQLLWNPNEGTITSEGGFQSPATCLEHEMDHAIDYVSNPKAHKQRSQISDDKYDTKEERRVTTGSEAKTAKANGEAVRKNHKGTPYRTISPTSTKKQRKI